MNDNDQLLAANYMAAIGHLLAGESDSLDDFVDGVELILAGSEPDVATLMRFTGAVRAGGRPVLWVHVPEETPEVPSIGLVVRSDDRVVVVENCVPWLPAGGGKAYLVPDSFRMGAFRLDDDMRLLPTRKPSSRLGAEKGMRRAYVRLRGIEAELRRSGAAPRLPQLYSTAKAA